MIWVSFVFCLGVGGTDPRNGQSPFFRPLAVPHPSTQVLMMTEGLGKGVSPPHEDKTQ